MFQSFLTNNDSRFNDSIPVINLSAFVEKNGSASEKRKASTAMRQACIESGFFYVKNHGVKNQEKIIKCAEQLFALPYHEKERLAAVKNSLFRGYISKEAGHHTCNVKETSSPDEKESFTIGAEITSNATPMHGSNSWPDVEQTPSLGDSDEWIGNVAEYWSQLLELSRYIAECLALSLGLAENYFEAALTDPCAQMVMLRYFIEDFGTDDQRTGCGPHTDCGFLTILQQQVGTRGLQVKTKNKKLLDKTLYAGMVDEYCWIDVPAIPDTFVVNLGDMAQFWSDGLYKSTLHRVLIKNDTATHNGPQKSLERYSIPFFCNCNFDTPIDVGGLVKDGEVSRLEGENEDSLENKMFSVVANKMLDMGKIDLNLVDSDKIDSDVAKVKEDSQLTAGVYIMERLGLMRKD